MEGHIFELLPVAVVTLNCHLYIIVGLYLFAFLLLLISNAVKIIVKFSLFLGVCLGHQKVQL